MFQLRRFLAAAALTGAGVLAQLSGNYTIDSSLPAGGGNYPDFASAITALTSAGVNGPVVFTVYPGTGNYAGWSITGPILGAGVVNNITFIAAPGTAPVISGVSAGALQAIRLGTAATAGTGPSWITLSGLTATGAPTGAGIGVHGGGNVTIQNCKVFGCGAGISLVTTANAVVEDCEVYSVGATPGTPGSATYAGGISAYLNSDNVVIRRNKVHDVTSNGIFVGTSGDTTACDNPVVVNNMIWNCPGGATYGGGIAFRRCPGGVLAHNSVSMSGGLYPGMFIQVMSSTTIITPIAVVANNIVEHLGTGPCVKIENATQVAPTLFDYNLYAPSATGNVAAVGTANYATLTAWQAVANIVGKETSTLVGIPGWVSSTDLHITGSSSGLFNGIALTQVLDDIDLQPRSGTPCRGADETTGTGIFAGFQASTTSGPAALTVGFIDTTFSSNGTPASWAWDFQNDGIVDSTLQFPTFTYVTPGTYSVSLTVSDPILGSNTLVRSNYITVSQYVFSATTSGFGTGDLTITPVPNLGVPAMTEGYTLISFTPAPTVGTGPFFGMIPDALTFSVINTPAAPGNPLHFVAGIPGLFPNAPFAVPAGSLTSLTGVTADFSQVCLGPGFSLLYWTPVSRLTF